MNKKLVVFDMDGTIYLGGQLFSGALDVFSWLKKNNIDYLFFTNNSSHDLEFYHKKMTNFGLECSLEHDFYSSTEVTISYLKDLGVKKIYALGNKCLRNRLVEAGFELVTRYDEEIRVEAVVVGFSTELVYDELKGACLYLETLDVPFIATNGDFRCPIEDGLFIPDCGGMCEWIRLCTGKTAKFMGKPNPEIVEYIARRYNITKDEILLVGDRLYTDILVGVNANTDTVCVLTGESTLEDIEKSEYKPTYILDSIRDLPDLLKK